MKKTIKLMGIFMLTLICAFNLVACDLFGGDDGSDDRDGKPGHTHSYGGWESDARHHWKECECGGKTNETAHTSTDWIIDEPATDITVGSRHEVCDVCAYIYASETIPALGHRYGAWIETTAPTCVTDGEETRTCINCTEIPSHTETRKGAVAFGHDYGAWSEPIAATETKDGYKTKTCSICLDVESEITETAGLEFTVINENEYEVVKGTADIIGLVVIPALRDGKPVTTIGYQAFMGCKMLENIVIPDSVTIIGDYAFSGCNWLRSITIPESVATIGDYAFSSCYWVKSLTIPESVATIGDYAFDNCSDLTSITIPSGTVIADNSFIRCSGLTSITVENGNAAHRSEGNCLIRKSDNALILGCITSVIPDSVTKIESYAFGYCAFKSIVITSGVTTIGSSAFLGCIRLESVTIPSSVTRIEGMAFYNCHALRDVYFGGTQDEWNAATNKSNTYIPSAATIHYNA